MKTALIVLSSLSLLVIASCDSNHGSYSSLTPAPAAMADSVAVNREDASTAQIVGNNGKALGLNDPSRKIIKTADLRCRVTDVFTATTRMERLAAATGGQISESHMENTTDEMRNLPYKPDSLKQVESYTTTAHLILRIPVLMLDTVLSDIAANASFINNRSLHLDDVTLRYLSNKLKNDAMAANDAAQRARQLARRSKEAVVSGGYTDQRDETRIDRQIENLQLTDQVTYATLTVDLYQPQRLTRTITPNVEYLMKPTLGQQAGIALNNGWQLLRAMLIGLLQIWPILIILITGITLYRLRKSKRTLARA